MGVLVGESPAGPNTPGLLGVEDLAGSMGKLCCNSRFGVFSGLLCAVHVELEMNPPANRQ